MFFLFIIIPIISLFHALNKIIGIKASWFKLISDQTLFECQIQCVNWYNVGLVKILCIQKCNNLSPCNMWCTPVFDMYVV